MSGPGSADRRAGFTLVELLVSMAVLALVALTMTAGLRFVVRAIASTDIRREALEELTLGLSVLRGELERAEPLMVKVGNRELVMFSGWPTGCASPMSSRPISPARPTSPTSMR